MSRAVSSRPDLVNLAASAPRLLESPAASTTSNHVQQQDGQSLLKSFVSGGVAAAVSKSVVAPIERVKLLLQVQHASKHIATEQRYKGIIDCLVRIPREQGFTSYWRGNTVNVIRAFPKDAINFASKDKYRAILREHVFNSPTSGNFWPRLSLNMLSGAAAGATSLSVLHPLDFARTRLAADTGRARQDRQFKGVVDCLAKTFRQDGIRGLYRGYLVSIPEIMLFRGLYFGFYDTFRPKKKLTLFTNYLIAQAVTTVSGFIAYPLDTVRRRMMMQSCVAPEERLYKNTRACWSKLYQSEGVLGFYKGVTANIMRGLGGAIVLVLYDRCKELI